MTRAQLATTYAAAPGLARAAVDAELRASAPALVEAARGRLNGHDETGRLRASVHADVKDGTLTLSADAPYASFVEARVGYIQGAIVQEVPGIVARIERSVTRALGGTP